MARNEFPGTCYRCGQTVHPGAGHYERFKGAFRVQHAECALAYRGGTRDATGPRPWMVPKHSRDLRSAICACGTQFITRIPEQLWCKCCIKSRKQGGLSEV